MVYIKKHTFKNLSFIQAFTNQKSLLFDYPAALYGVNHAHPSFKSPQKELKFEVKIIKNIDSLFVSSSDSFGVFFINYSTRIYCTKPVYEQLLLKYEEYRTMSVTYDAEKDSSEYKIVSIHDANLEQFKRNVIFIKYNQRISIDQFLINPIAAGTFIGWANYRITFPTGESLIYLTSYSNKRRFFY